MWVEQASARRIVALVLGIGPDSALHRSQYPDTWHWSNELELAAVQVEMTDALYRAFIRANSKENAAQPKPVKIPRPNRPRQRGTSMAELTQMFPLKPKE